MCAQFQLCAISDEGGKAVTILCYLFYHPHLLFSGALATVTMATEEAVSLLLAHLSSLPHLEM